MASSTSLTPVSIVGTPALARRRRPLYLDPIPPLNPITDPLSIGIIEDRSANTIAVFAALMVYSRVVLLSGVHPNRDGDFLARPALGMTSAIAANEAAHDVRVPESNITIVVIHIEEV
ncbi:uncharacterized protein APUU_70066S [Aspergillus puulaauensis]|uniref:Uncharacterized protein n=1 Tax=Aspergillus puulaauensis TaxID=1220207 RepID=A0A7R8ARI3_9EURO|nr:uncharacterized protein APUU_70066S [Aspergillus puulaauensis]BCS28496.1 hypothetical protein APUU_70066S [Aspergillus puulaauensis]